MQLQEHEWAQKALLSRASSWTQANVYLVHQGEQKIVVKDYGESPAWLRISLCRFVMRREIKALQRLQKANLAPQYLGLISQYAYAMAHIEQRPIERYNQMMVSAIDAAVQHMHDQGVAHNDLHRRNLLMTVDGQVYFGDFGGAYFKSTHLGALGKIKNKLFGFFVMLDNAKVAQLKQRYAPDLLTSNEKNLLSVKNKVGLITKAWKKLINEPLLRKRAWQQRGETVHSWAMNMRKYFL